MTILQKLTAPLPPEWYWQDEWLEREQTEVFAKNWYFAGFKQDLAKHNDYVSFTVAGVPVIVRNMKDSLVAFRNICSHRHSTIHPRGCGSAMFRCPYHGWTYDEKGVPVGIPDNARSFGFDKEAKCELALDAVAVETCVNFVFVRLAEHGPSLNEWLGSLAAKLEHASELFTEMYSRRDDVWKCNWKSGIEISVEGYHAPFVHPSTFSEYLGVTETPDGVADAKPAENPSSRHPAGSTDDTEVHPHIEYAGLHAISYGPVSFDSSQHLGLAGRRLKLPRSEHARGYEHYLICPNLQIGINGGFNISVIRYEPLSPDQTLVECWLMTGMPQDPRIKDGLLWRTVTKNWDDWNQSVLAEDRLACEKAQDGMRYARRTGFLGRAEDRVRYFQSVLFDQMNGRKAAA